MNEFELSIIIVNYMKYEMTQQCINSIKLYLNNINYEIIVFDNNSLNSSYFTLREIYSNENRIRVYKSDVNGGFGFGNNKAVEYAKSDLVLFLNPDVILIDDSIVKMLSIIKSDRDIGIIGAQLLNGDFSLQYSCRRFLPFLEFIQARTPIKKIISKEKVMLLNDKYLMKDVNHDIPQDVDWIMGSCLLVRKEEFLGIGGFSEEYFMYFEDVDLCYKYHLNNQRVYYYPHTKIIHLHEQGSVKKLNKLTFRHLESMFKFYIKFKNDLIRR